MRHRSTRRPESTVATTKPTRCLIAALMLALAALAAPAEPMAADRERPAATVKWAPAGLQTKTIPDLDDRSLQREVAGDVGGFQEIDAITLDDGEHAVRASVMDPAGEFAYFGTSTAPGRVVKIDLETFERVGTITLADGEDELVSAVIDPAGEFAYFGTNTFQGQVVKVDLETFERVGAITLESDEGRLESAVIDPAGELAYFGTNTSPGRVVKIDLATFERVGAITLDSGEDGLISAVIDPAGELAYFGTFTTPGRVVRIDLQTFERVDAITLDSGEDGLAAAVIDPAGELAYFGTSIEQGWVVKIDLDPFERVDAISLGSKNFIVAAAIDPAGELAYFGLFSERAVRVDLDSFEPDAATTLNTGELILSAVIDPAGEFVYFGTGMLFDPELPPARVVKVGPALTSAALEVDYAELASDGNGVFEPGEQVDVAPAWRNDAEVPHAFTGTASELTGPPGPDYTIVFDAADYGEIDSQATGSCRDTDTCYQMEVGPAGAPRPATHWDASFQETLSDATVKTWTLHLGDSFADVPRVSPFYTAVESLLHNGVDDDPQLARRDLLVLGCGDTEFCPTLPSTRAQTAVLLLKGLEGGAFEPEPCVPGSARFDDVPAESPFCPWVEELARREVTAGCGADRYCPEDPLTRAQAAVLLLKTLHGADHEPPECEGVFEDVTCPSLFADWIDELFNAGFTAGCGVDPLRFCPDGEVTRAQMAAFVVKAFGLVLYGP